jgi:preprotein translocase subunit SecF
MSIDFLGKSRGPVTVSAVLVLTSWALVAFLGLNYGIDFAGGTEVLVKFDKPVDDLGDLKSTVEATGLEKPEVVTFGLAESGRYFVRSRSQSLLAEDEVQKVRAAVAAKLGEPKLFDATDEAGEEIRVQWEGNKDQAEIQAAAQSVNPKITVGLQAARANSIYIIRMPGVRMRVTDALQAKYGDAFVGIERLESVGSAVGAQMREQGILAIIYALIGILLYISFRFDLRYSPGAVLALVHDVSITVGLYAILGMEFNLPIVAALLAIVGYSLNDTIVVYDRIRESIQLGLEKGLVANINRSINDCLSRTVLTSVTTFLAVLSIYIFGGGIIQNFAFAMLVGVVVGTYSSVFIASPAVVAMDAYLTARAEANPQAGTTQAASRG